MKATIIIFFLFLISSLANSKLEWVKKSDFQEETIKNIECVDSLNCYAFTEGRKEETRIYHSTDLGHSWDLIYEQVPDTWVDSIYSPHRCKVLDKDHLYVTFKTCVALDKSTDGGKTFDRITFGEYSSRDIPVGPVYSFKMYDKNIGILVTTKTNIYTFDGWKTYKVYHKKDDDSSAKCLFFIDSNNVAMKRTRWGYDDLVLFNLKTEEVTRYSDRSITKPGEPRKDLFRVFFVDENIGFGCGGQKTGHGDSRENLIWKTTDKGKHWRIVNENIGPITGFGLTAIAFRSDGERGMAAGNWGVMMESNDYGESWEYIEPPEINKVATTPRMAFAGQYPLISTSAGGIQRQELVDDVEDEDVTNIKTWTSQDNLKIQLHKFFADIEISVCDLLGRPVLNEPFKNQQHISIDISSLQSGLYLWTATSRCELIGKGKIIR
jgi:photosystem II stability/assembly factor-like uncharacterized protein